MSDFKSVKNIGSAEANLLLHPPLSARKQRLEIAYKPAPGLREAADVAMMLGAPLLLTGEPGTGKTSASYWLASELGAPEPLIHNVKSASSARNLLYDFDEVARFRDGSRGETRPLIDYISFNGLGEAIIRAAGGSAGLKDYAGRSPSQKAMARAFGPDVINATVGSLLPHDSTFATSGPQHYVVLLDELDKASRDTPNDLLAEIDEMKFSIPELGFVVEASSDIRPVIIMTSNSEKSLPEPFLRRCAFFDIPFPEPDDLEQILVGTLGAVGKGDLLVTSAMDIFYRIRNEEQISKKPSTSELIAWIDIILGSKKLSKEQSLIDALKHDNSVLDTSLSALLKTDGDQSLGKGILRKMAVN